MDQPPTTSPELLAFGIRYVTFNHPNYQPPRPWSPFLAPVICAVIVLFLGFVAAIRHIRRSFETPAAAPPAQPETPPPHYDTTPSEAASEGAGDMLLLELQPQPLSAGSSMAASAA